MREGEVKGSRKAGEGQCVMCDIHADPDQPSSMEKSRFFLHKPSRQRMEDAEAVIPGMNQVRPLFN